jgi:general stress protein YciG
MANEQESKEHKSEESQKRTAGKMTVEEAGRLGGERTAQTRGHEFYQSIGRKGGEVVSRDRQHMSSIGRKGGEAVSRDRAHMALIGQKGGEARSRHFKAQQQEKKKVGEPLAGQTTSEKPASASSFTKTGPDQEKAG